MKKCQLQYAYLHHDPAKEDVTAYKLTRYPIQTIPQPSAVFDLHFQPPHQGRAADVCAAVSSTGTISLFRLTPPPPPGVTATTTTTPETEVLTQLSVLRIPNLGDDTLFTFFAWHPTIAGLMAITTAVGSVALVQIYKDYQGLDVWHEALMEHDGLEAWCVAFSQTPSQSGLGQSASPPSTIFSGGDDSKLRYALYDAAAAEPTKDDETNSLSNQRVPYPPVSLGNHEAGVTFILPLPIPNKDGTYLVATGSYDEYLRVWKIAPLYQTGGLRRASLVAEKRLDGGVWRLNTLDVEAETKASTTARPWEVILLVSCMHAGSRIVRIRGANDGKGELEVLARFEEHKSMNYGSDWFRGDGRGSEGDRLCVSTSFYDRLLCVWTFKNGVGSGTVT